jgi:class 3 adenylate cyclase
MGTFPDDPALAHWAKVIEDLRWAAFITDRDYRLVWTSSETRQFLGSPTDEELGHGLNVIEALTNEAWMRIATPESQVRVLSEIVPYLMGEMESRGVRLADILPDQFRPLLEQMEPKSLPSSIPTSFDYIEPKGDSDLPVYSVDLLLMPLHDERDERVGVMGLSYMQVRPGLVSLLARGEESMYERMAKLVEPQPRQAAILLCDLQDASNVSRMLSTTAYFRLIRRLWTDIDKTVAANQGIVGKHAVDGAAAFFLVEDAGSPSKAAEAAIRTARAIHERSSETFSDVLQSPCMMRVGVHWGGSICIGQLVPGGRLEVTALGDEVNQCARIQECASSHETLASKRILEQLDDEDASALDLDLERISYRSIAEFPDVTELALRDAGGLPVTPV